MKSKLDKIIKILLKNRKITTKKEEKEFFNPKNPRKITLEEVGINPKSTKKAITRIKKALRKKEKIIVYGDYDVDGICAAAILWETLNAIGANVLPYIPSRFTEGYGLNKESIEKLKKENPEVGLIITVDNGIVAHEKIDFAKGLGVDVIITDHHLPGTTLPDAHAIVHTTAISGSAVAWFLARELVKNFPLDHLGLAALGTVADVLPLINYNRSIVYHGLKVLRTTDRPGIKALCNQSQIKQEEIDTFHIGFILSPRLNAAGRVEHALNSLRLLCVRGKQKAYELAVLLDQANRLRQEKTEFALKHIEKTHTSIWQKNLPGILFAYHSLYEEGVVGIVAGRLVEKYRRPAIVMRLGQIHSKASARSITGINIIETIRQVGDDFLVNAGGHPMAAGFTIETKHISKFSKRLQDFCQKLPQEAFIKEAKVDYEISFSDITENLYEKIAKFAPFGFGNPQPTFRTVDVFVKNVRLVGKDNTHLRLVLSQSNNQATKLSSYQAIGFRMGELYPKLEPDEPVSIVYSIEQDKWLAQRSPALPAGRHGEVGSGKIKLQLKLKNLEVIPNLL